MTTCLLPECSKPAKARGYCSTDYARLTYQGLIVTRKYLLPPEEAIRNAVSVVYVPDVQVLGPCWISTGEPGPNGYARLSIQGVRDYLHRHSHRVFIGPIPDKAEVDHLCFIRMCGAPHHLEAVSHSVNTARSTAPSAMNGRKEVCDEGHALDEANTYIWIGPTGNVQRHCRKCHCAREREAYRRRRGLEGPGVPRVLASTAR